MFKSGQTYIKTNNTQSASAEEFAGKRFITAAFMAVSVGVLSLQTGFVLNASANGNPISSPISTQESPSPSPSASSAPATPPEVSPSPSASAVPSPTPTPAPTSNGNSNNNNSNNNSGSNSSNSCGAQAPKATKIVSALTTGKNQITLNWEKISGNVTHYAVSYGLQKGKPLYGNSNVGNTTSSAIKGLTNGTTYYFRVKGVNDCAAGEYSNEIGVKVGGKYVAPKQALKQPNLKPVKSNAAAKPSAVPSIFNTQIKAENTGLAGKVFNFFKGVFN